MVDVNLSQELLIRILSHWILKSHHILSFGNLKAETRLYRAVRQWQQKQARLDAINKEYEAWQGLKVQGFQPCTLRFIGHELLTNEQVLSKASLPCLPRSVCLFAFLILDTNAERGAWLQGFLRLLFYRLGGVTKDPDTTGSEAVCLGFNSGFRVRLLVEVPSAIRIHGPGSEGLEIGGSFQKASPTDMTEDS